MVEVCTSISMSVCLHFVLIEVLFLVHSQQLTKINWSLQTKKKPTNYGILIVYFHLKKQAWRFLKCFNMRGISKFLFTIACTTYSCDNALVRLCSCTEEKKSLAKNNTWCVNSCLPNAQKDLYRILRIGICWRLT